MKSVPAGAAILSSSEQGNAGSQEVVRFLKEISGFDIVHFGEMHPRNDKQTSTLEDFVDIFLPGLRDTNIVGRPYNLIRTEGLPFELDHEGNQFIPEDELAEFDKSGLITPLKTPTLYGEYFAEIRFYSKDSYGNLKLAREATLLGFKVRGTSPAKKRLAALVDKARMEGQPPLIKARITLAAYTDNYLTALRRDMKGNNRCAVYGGGFHNDDNDILRAGIADEMKGEFPGRYAAIDLIKPGVVDQNEPYYKPYESLLGDRGIDARNKITVIKTDNDPSANYIVFLPERKVAD